MAGTASCRRRASKWSPGDARSGRSAGAARYQVVALGTIVLIGCSVLLCKRDIGFLPTGGHEKRAGGRESAGARHRFCLGVGGRRCRPWR